MIITKNLKDIAKTIVILVAFLAVVYKYNHDDTSDSAGDAPIPAEERAFIAAVTKWRQEFSQSENEIAKSTMRLARAKEICRTLSDPTVSDWVGIVDSLSTNGDGNGVISIAISRDIKITTWNNFLSDLVDKTVIDRRSTIFANALQFKIRQSVIFSGSFIKSERDCYKESSLTASGSMLQPEFIFRFSEIEGL